MYENLYSQNYFILKDIIHKLTIKNLLVELDV